jgi:hypothetical protein
MGINRVFRFFIFLAVTTTGYQAWARTLHSPKISGRVHNQTQAVTSELKLLVTAVCVRRFSAKNDKDCGQKKVTVPVGSDGTYTVPSLAVKVDGYRILNRPRLKISINIMLPDGQYLFKQKPQHVSREALTIAQARQVLKEFTLFQLGGHDLRFSLPSGEPFDTWLSTNDADGRLHLLFRILSGDLLPFTAKVYGDVFAYMSSVKSSVLQMPKFYLAFSGDYTQGKMVNMEYFVTADGRYTANDYFRFNDHVEMSSDILLPFSDVMLKPQGCCQGPPQED